MPPPFQLNLVFPATSASAFWTLVRNLPRLCDGQLMSCDITWSDGPEPSVCAARLAGPLGGRVRERIAFWAAVYGVELASEPPAPAEGTRQSTWTDVRAAMVPLLADAFVDGGSKVGSRLFVDLRRCDVEPVKLEQGLTSLFVAGETAPPLGDDLVLGFPDAPGSDELAFVHGSVTGRMLAPRNGSVHGFGVEVANADDRFTAWAAALPTRTGHAPWRRREHRVPIRVAATLVRRGGDGAAEEVRVENVSRTGALVVAKSELPVGTVVSLRLALRSAELSLVGTVVRKGQDGAGIRFDRDPFANARLAAELERLADAPRRALVIDDDALARRMLSDSLQQRGFEVVTAPSGDDGVLALERRPDEFHAVVTDVCMPGVSGEELVRALRRISGPNNVPIVAMTGSATAEAVRRMEAAGVDLVLSKSTGAQSIAEAVCEIAARPAPGAQREASA